MTSLSQYQNKKNVMKVSLLLVPYKWDYSNDGTAFPIQRMWFRPVFCFWSRVKPTGVSRPTCRSSFLWHAITILRTAESLQSHIFFLYLLSLLSKSANQENDWLGSLSKRTPFFSSPSWKCFDFISTLHAHLLRRPYLNSSEHSPPGGPRPSSAPLSRLH